MKKIPSYRHLKSRNLGYVEINGHRTYLGRYGTENSLKAYQRIIAEWQAGHAPKKQGGLSVVDLCLAYEDYAKGYYRLPDGTLSTMLFWITSASDTLVRLYGDEPAADVGPLRLQTVRHQWVVAGLARATCNKYTGCIKRMYKWAVAQELVSADVYAALCSVDGLRRGKTEARETAPRAPVSREHVDAVLPHLSRQVAAIIELLWLTCARPDEICPLRPVDIDRSGRIWVAELARHKNASRGKRRAIFFGPRAQAILREFLLRDDSAYLFSPAEAEAVRNDRRRSVATCSRRENQKPNPRKGPRTFKARYTPQTVCQAVERACVKAGIPQWTPYQLRHAAATAIRAEHGVEATQDVLGHETPDMTVIYAQRRDERVKQIMMEMG